MSGRQRAALERLGRAAGTAQQLALRVRIILAAADGTSNRGIAQRLGVTRNTVHCWRGRWATAAEALLAVEAEGDDRAVAEVVRRVLADEPRPGAPATFTPEQLCQVVAIACEAPPDAGRPTSHWTPREIADEAVTRGIVARISVRSVGRFLGRGAPQAAP